VIFIGISIITHRVVIGLALDENKVCLRNFWWVGRAFEFLFGSKRGAGV